MFLLTNKLFTKIFNFLSNCAFVKAINFFLTIQIYLFSYYFGIITQLVNYRFFSIFVYLNKQKNIKFRACHQFLTLFNVVFFTRQIIFSKKIIDLYTKIIFDLIFISFESRHFKRHL